MEEQFKLGHYPYLEHEVPPQRIPGRSIAAICTTILIIALAWWFRPRSAPVKIAVLPLDNQSHDPADEYLADGLTDELIRSLTTFEGLAPQPLTSTFGLNGKKLNAWQTGEQLSADYIVEGSVLRSGDQLRADTQLVRVRDNVTVWSGKFARRVSDLRDLQDEISKTIVANLPIRLGLRKKHAAFNPEVYNLYLRATSLGLEDGIPLFEQVVAKDPAFAAAYAGLASSLAYKTGNAASAPRIDLPRMRAAAERAIQLEPLLPEANGALGIALARDGKWFEAEESFRRAIALNPHRSESYADFSVYVLMQEERIDEALEQMRLAQESNLLSPEVRSELAYVLLSSHRYDEAGAQCEKLPEDCHCWPAPRERVRYECLGRARIGQGRLQEAIEVLADGVKDALPDAPIRGYLALAFGRGGHPEEAAKIAESDWRFPHHQALAFIGMGDRNHAIAAMERMAPQGPVRVGLALAEPELDSIRDDPRMKALRAHLGLPR